MFIITKNDTINNPTNSTLENVPVVANDTLHIIFGKNIVYANKWIKDYISIDIDSLKYKPNEKYIKNVEYNIVQDKNENNKNRVFYLQKIYTKLVKGYVYNSYVTNVENIYSIKLTYIHTTSPSDDTLSMQNNDYCDKVTSEILMKLDKESLLGIFFNFYKELNKKNVWTKIEFLNLQRIILEKYNCKSLKHKIE